MMVKKRSSIVLSSQAAHKTEHITEHNKVVFPKEWLLGTVFLFLN